MKCVDDMNKKHAARMNWLNTKTGPIEINAEVEDFISHSIKIIKCFRYYHRLKPLMLIFRPR